MIEKATLIKNTLSEHAVCADCTADVIVIKLTSFSLSLIQLSLLTAAAAQPQVSLDSLNLCLTLLLEKNLTS